MSFLDILQPCPTYNNLHTKDWYAGKDLERGQAAGLTRADVVTGTPLYLSPEAVTGDGVALVKLGEPYGSPRPIELGKELMRFVDEESKIESERLAGERGTFPQWERSIWGTDEKAARDERGMRVRPMRALRNCNLTTVAPTGTISIIAGCASGIEPLFAVAFMRNQAGVLMPDVNPEFVRMAEEGGWYSEDLMRRIADEGHIHFDEVPAEVQEAFVTAHDVTPEQPGLKHDFLREVVLDQIEGKIVIFIDEIDAVGRHRGAGLGPPLRPLLRRSELVRGTAHNSQATVSANSASVGNRSTSSTMESGTGHLSRTLSKPDPADSKRPG